MIAIIDYEMGNLRSVQKALERVGAKTVITQTPSDIQKCDKLVLPGVGAMQPAMEKLQALNLISEIKNFITSGKPFLGICLGLQLLFETSTEGGNTEGLGVLPGTVERFTDLKVPHMGWNQIQIQSKDCALFNGIHNGINTYFCHSYYVKPTDDSISSTKTDYGINFTSSICKDNVYAIQFHPEKSQEVGLKILENFVKL